MSTAIAGQRRKYLKGLIEKQMPRKGDQKMGRMKQGQRKKAKGNLGIFVAEEMENELNEDYTISVITDVTPSNVPHQQ